MSDVEEPTVEETTYEVEEDAAEFVGGDAAPKIMLFGKWSFEDIEVRDISLQVCISMNEIPSVVMNKMKKKTK